MTSTAPPDSPCALGFTRPMWLRMWIHILRQHNDYWQAVWVSDNLDAGYIKDDPYSVVIVRDSRDQLRDRDPNCPVALDRPDLVRGGTDE